MRAIFSSFAGVFWLPYEEFLAMQERLVDVEDLLELRKAKRSERKEKSIPLADVKHELGLR